MNKRITIYSVIVLLAIANYGLLDYNHRTTGQFEANNGLVRVSNEPILGNSAFTGPLLFKISSASIQNINNLDFFIGDGTASISANAAISFAVDSRSQNVRFGGYVNCNLDTDGDGDLVCGTDASGVGGGTIEIQNSGTDLGNFTSISFDAGHFTATDTTGEATIKLDWGSGGPASLSEAETITGNWVNTANPWADNEVIDTLTASNYLPKDL